MVDVLKKTLTVAAIMLLLDGLWLMVIAKKFYFESLKHIASVDAGAFKVQPLAAAMVYIFMVALFMIFLEPAVRAASWPEVLLKSALFGLMVYGVYDFTNLATLKDWPASISYVDMFWGATLYMITSAVYKLIFLS